MGFQHLASAAVCFGLFMAAPVAAQEPVSPKAVIATHIKLAEAMYGDALAGARDLKSAIDAFLAAPSAATLQAARAAWLKARVPYQQTEAFRFGNKAVDELEGKVNAWPLDEGLIDYVDTKLYGTKSDENPLFRANVIASKRIRIGRDQVDVSKITKDLLSGKLQEAQGVEANVATGYHAVEFLLWGQDLNGTGPGAGKRPFTDYVEGKGCTGGNCDRRRTYLRVVTDLLVDDVAAFVTAWAPGGDARKEIEAKDEKEGLASILTGLGSLSYGELAGERMKLGLILHDPEEEHDCFSDNTHNSHYYDEIGMVALFEGRYTKTNGEVVQGPSLKALVDGQAAEEGARLAAAMAAATGRLAAIKARADAGTEAYDQMIGEGNAAGNKLVQEAVDSLVAQARAIEAVVAKLGLTISVEGSDSLDKPDSVGK
jgi:putative iron-regulated protein